MTTKKTDEQEVVLGVGAEGDPTRPHLSAKDLESEKRRPAAAREREADDE